MNIRTASIEDIELLVQVRFDYFKAKNWTFSSDRESLMRDGLIQYYAKHLNHDFFAVFADEAAEVVSVAFLVIAERPANPSWPTGRIGTILNVHTYEPFRRRGYATGVLSRLIKDAEEQDLSYIELSASASGKPIYEKLGFRVVEPGEFVEMKLRLSI